MFVLIEKDAALNFDSIPINVFNYITNIAGIIGDYQSFEVANLSPEDLIALLPEDYVRNKTYSYANNILTIKNSTATRMAIAANAVAMETVGNHTALNPVMEDVLDDIEDALDNAERDNGEMNEGAHPSCGLVTPKIDKIKKIEKENVVSVLSEIIKDKPSFDRSKLLKEKVSQLDKMMSSIIILQREIDNLRAGIYDNPAIKKIIESVDGVAVRPDIDSIFFSKDSLVIQTKELSTNTIINGSKRLIGKMRFIIPISNLIGLENVRGQSIIIENIDREYYDGCDRFQCGHVCNRNACWGTAFENLYKAFALSDVEQIVEIIIRFIKNPNVDDCWCFHLIHWPEAIN
jgi:hypothetical protein